MLMNDPASLRADGEAWWRFPLLWMVMALPAAVVLASFLTLWLALRTPDPVVGANGSRPGPELAKQQGGKMLMPAVAGRNHAATPAQDLPAPKR
jgi:uncharacterized protein